MPRRKTSIRDGSDYHIYNCGVNRERIFFEPENYAFFLRRFRAYALDSGQCALLAYCLMPNHIHLLVRVTGPAFPRAMQRLLTSYAKAINKRFGRSGPLFNGTYRSELITHVAQLQELIPRILANPVRVGLVAEPHHWPYAGRRLPPDDRPVGPSAVRRIWGVRPETSS